MEGVTTWIYRAAYHRHFAPAVRYFTPFIAPNMNKGLNTRERNDVLPEHNEGQALIPQILTNRADYFLTTCRDLAELGYDEVNLNLGCPSGTVVSKGKGSGFLANPEELERFLDVIFETCPLKISIKTRVGRTDEAEWPRLLELYRRYPCTELIIHPRIQKEFYKGTPHLDVFADILKESRNPVVYNGDLFTVEKVKEFREKFPTVGTVMIGRGLIRNPALAEMILQEETEACTDRLENGVRIFEADGQLQTQGNRNKGDILPRIREFHDALFEHYRETMSGDRNLLFRMKDLWSYMLAEVLDSEKLAKKIRKSQHVPEYLAAVEEVFARWDANR